MSERAICRYPPLGSAGGALVGSGSSCAVTDSEEEDDAEVVIVDPPPKVKREPKVKLEPKEAKKPLKRVTRSSKRQKTASPAPDREVTDLTVEDTGETMSVEEARELYRFNNAQVLQDMAVEDDERGYTGHPALAGPSNASASASVSVGAGPSTSGASTSVLPTTASSDLRWETPEPDEGSAIPTRWSLGIPPPPPPAKKFE
ncbi:hypothetical protein EXIGLDRAFT_777071 [Exidia glandulosa HHB12029]|uniref:Uncharacterized protein n=1 Tax=Exidia glandulosa HHB12029 TaxID=1314781 RepID=A0A165D7E2_EXIGL|nr:hypothetical protein EXIGLDRAFT_777071 [Exidia glandulosa HHB12029]